MKALRNSFLRHILVCGALLLGATRATDPVKIEQDLIPLFPRPDWTLLSHLLIDHGRKICNARKPLCASCFLADLCPSAQI